MPASPRPSRPIRAWWEVLRDGPAVARIAALVRHRLGQPRQPRQGAGAGARAAAGRMPRRRRARRSRATGCATTTTSCRSRRRHRGARRWPSCWRPSTGGCATGGSAARSSNYRRFFDVTTLAGLRVEDPEVFAATHREILASVADGTRDTGCGSTIRTVSPTRRATSPGSSEASRRLLGRRREDPRGTASSCPPSGRATAPRATTRSTGSSASSSTRAARSR